MSNKYNARKVEIEGITFDSKFESEVYLLLRSFLPKYEIKVHYPIEIAPATQRYPQWNWKCDFYVEKWNWLIEAKGVRTDEWKAKIRAIDALNPKVLNNLTIVSERHGEKVCKGLFTVDKPTLQTFLNVRIQRRST